MRRSKLRRVLRDGHAIAQGLLLLAHAWHSMVLFDVTAVSSQVLNENARKPLSIGYLAFSLCSDILAALSVF